jgi:hypothetical protein
MTFALLDQTDTEPKKNQNFDFNLGDHLKSLFEPQQPSLAPAIDSPSPIRRSSGFIKPNFNTFQNSQSKPISFPEIKLPNQNSGSRAIPFPEIKVPNSYSQSRPVSFPDTDSFDSGPNPLDSFFESLDKDQKPISPIQTLPDRIKSLDSLSLDQVLNPGVDRTHKLLDGLSRDEIENKFLKKLSFVPRQKNDEPSTALNLTRGADNPEQVAGLGWEFLKRIIGKKGIEKAFEKGKELLKPSAKTNKPKKENKQQEPTTQKPNTRTVDPKSKDFIQNNSKKEIAKSISQAADAIAEINGIAKGSEQYKELAKDLGKTWEDEKRHPKYWPITNPKTKTKSFGVISKGKNISPGEIRLPIGHNQIGKVKLRKKHLEEYKKLGFNSVEEYVNYVGERYGEIYQDTTNGRLVIIKRNGKSSNLVLELSPTGEEVYNVISGFPQETEEFNERVEKGRFKLIGRRQQNSGS